MKLRGNKRRLKQVLRDLDNEIPYTDLERWCDWGHEWFLMPCAYRFINTVNKNGRAKVAVIKKVLEVAEKFISLKPKNLEFCKVVAYIDEHDLFGSQICVYYKKESYESIVYKNLDTFKMVTPKIPLSKKYNFTTSLKGTCYVGYWGESVRDITITEWIYEEQ